MLFIYVEQSFWIGSEWLSFSLELLILSTMAIISRNHFTCCLSMASGGFFSITHWERSSDQNRHLLFTFFECLASTHFEIVSWNKRLNAHTCENIHLTSIIDFFVRNCEPGISVFLSNVAKCGKIWQHVADPSEKMTKISFYRIKCVFKLNSIE